MKSYVVRDLNDSSILKVETRTHPAPNVVCSISKELKDKAFKIVDDVRIFESPRIAADESGEILMEQILDESGNPVLDSDDNPIMQEVLERDENGVIIMDSHREIMGKKAILDEDAEILRLAKIDQTIVDRKWEAMRTKRGKLLRETDHIMMPDFPIGDRTEYEVYRQKLRDLPANISDIDNFVFPVIPIA